MTNRALFGSFASAIVALALFGPEPAVAQQGEGWIRIDQPAEWRGEVVTRGITVQPRRSIRIEGRAFHPGGVYRIEVNGTVAAMSQADGEPYVEFVAYADPAQASNTIEIVAFSEGGIVSRSYQYEVGERVETVSPEDTWAEQFRGERYAVVIGISEYQDTTINPLQYADDDAQAVYDFLTSPRAGMGGFKPENITFLLNEEANYRAMRTALYTDLQRVTDRDLVFVYVAGHGVADPFRTSDYYLLTHDAEPDNLAATAFPMREFSSVIERLNARDIIVITDACHSGGVAAASAGLRAVTTFNDINRIFGEEMAASSGGMVTFTASENNQYSREDARWGGGHGVFTHYFLQGLRGEADDDGDGIVRLGEAMEYTRYAVMRDTRQAQIPTISSTNFDRYLPLAIASGDVVAEAEPEPEVATPPPAPPEEVVEEEPEPTPTPADEEEATTGAQVDLINPAGAFVQSLILPGSGQFRTGRGLRGFLVMAGAVGAATYGFVYQQEERICGVPLQGGTCPSGGVVTSSVTKPYMTIGIAAAGGLAFLGALDAVFGANKVNQERLRAVGQTTAGLSLDVLPREPTLTTRAGDVSLLELRFR